ncbi:MAG: hypothetical protein QXL51_03480 [Candidatus Aenigmatarchaeota archaeon]
MAKGRTISALELTEKDRKALEICLKISETLRDLIPKQDKKEEFWKVFGKVHMSRDAGLGRGGGKLQRDALCTRGRTDKAPFSNRNLRWHPLIVAYEVPNYANEVDEIKIKNRKLIFIIDGKEYEPEQIYTLKDVYCAPLYKWKNLVDELKKWNDNDWTNNSCVIPAAEYSPVNFSVETFSLLGLIIVSTFYEVNLLEVYDELHPILEAGLKSINTSISEYFPTKEKIGEVVNCPLCLAPVNYPPAKIKFGMRPQIWQPLWRKSKREEGEAESLQLTHIKPLIESEIRHTAKLTRYGHRWCNVTMADHSVDETVDFMKSIVEAHEKFNKRIN